MSERWRTYPGEGRIEVSTLGRVRFVLRKRVEAFGLYTTSLGGALPLYWFGDSIRFKRANVLVLETWVGSRPDGCSANHINGNPWDCRLSNLEWRSHE